MSLQGGVIDDAATFVFTSGWCWAWAGVEAMETDGAVSVMRIDREPEDRVDWVHAWCQRPSGLLSDVLGTITPDLAERIYGGQLDTFEVSSASFGQLAYECEDDRPSRVTEACLAAKWVMGIE